MKRERWDVVVSLFEEALAVKPPERRAFVETAARGDAALRDEVLALLAADESVHPLFSMSPAGLAAAVQVPANTSYAGRQIGAYKLIREIGRGGMATVYHAEDTKHRRAVALKLLDAGASTALGGERFRREIDVLARLQHHNILPLFDSGEAEGLLYYVMPLVGGGTLRERIAREGPLAIDDVRRITSQIAAGLEYAHKHHVIHRDVKPANVLLDDDHASIGDFGIAQGTAPVDGGRLTLTGVFVGTPAYMSPEHVAGGGQLDARSDVYSLACVVFEMLTGKPPFQGTSPSALLGKHLHDTAPSARTGRPELPTAVASVLQRALEKDPNARYASAREFARAFENAFEQARTLPSAVTIGTRRWVVIAAVAALVAVAGALLWNATREMPSIAVLPFVNMSGDQANDYFSDGVTEELTSALAQLGRVRVTPRTTAFAYKGRTGDIRQIGNELGVSRILEGSIRRDGERVMFMATLYDANTGDRLWFDRYERDWSALLALQTEIAVTIAEQLRVRLVRAERTRLANRHSENADAYANYLRGRYFFDLRTSLSLRQALIHFERAIALDSTYARAHAGLADTYSILAWTGSGPPRELFSHADIAARRALSLDSTIAEAHVSLGIINTFHTWDWAAAGRASARAIALDSTLAVAWFFQTWPLVAQGRTQDGLESLMRARELEPFSLITNARVGTLLAWLGRLDEAEASLRTALELDPTYPVARVQLARVLSLRGKHDEARAALPPDSIRFGSYEAGIAGLVYARAGFRDSALRTIKALQSRDYVPAEGVAAVYTALGDREAALTWLEKAVEARGSGLIFLAAEPMYQPLHNEPRFQRIVQQLKLGRST